MWEDCLWNYVFPTLDRASHMVNEKIKNDCIMSFLVAFFESSESSECRLQHLQKMNGKGKSLEHGEEKQFTCSYITGL